jgi:hypothetical protein
MLGGVIADAELIEADCWKPCDAANAEDDIRARMEAHTNRFIAQIPLRRWDFLAGSPLQQSTPPWLGEVHEHDACQI